ncbi:serine/threonine-protein phosphatase 4 regulatory subunit 4-like isoform X5 [Temnothorax curvispinosus]|uniref:Serine/threonine-protein phosphatase 4 regulatory subunit 4-like isoform X5 n=1 Tax=Temnothorax curvispinosus TaxID=300111 RepID=A0A6J1QQK9_9HYME|nr:serine/threonine-protein phosphatase 4 regulatory subunit 4-like isoform X5 [Temnothorax curvispinosus]XP_024884762.1 serine/threonine-protein phosphatase 4 regulatory subunit 4-like isoform X5 [Temnothorax curvispinosus]
MLQEGDEAPYEIASDPKGDEIQKLSVIQSLPSLLATDTQSCMSRVVPKMQQSLATASTEFHIAASSTFKTILEQKLVSHNVFSQTFLQSILNSLESRDPVICHAWLETLLDVIELLPVEVIRAQILPLTISKGQLSQPIYSRITCSRLLGKICTRFDSAMIQKEVLPTVHSLCQDVSSEVRASICLQLRFVAEGLGAESVKPALLPSLVELASDEESSVRYASVQTIVYLLPHLQEDTIKNIIAPLIKKLCENAAKSEDNVICIIAQELGKLVLGLEKCLSMFEKAWFINYFQQLAQMGIPSLKKEKPHFTFISSNPTQDERYVECRRHCAFNLPAMFIFVSGSSEDVDAILTTFDALTSDHYYMVRKTVACGIHEVSKVLGPKSARIKGNLIKLLKDDSEEVLQGLIPHIGLTLECLAESQALGTDRMDSSLMEIGKALLKCEAEVAGTHNWRLASLMHAQLEILPKCFPSDFIYSYFIPMAFSRILHARPIPVRLAAGTLFLLLLRYNMKPIQRAELRSRIFTDLANNPDCYVRMMFVRMMVEALEIFSSVYFKEHFFIVLLNLAEDPIANIRMKVVSLLPQLKNQLWMPTDKKLLTSLESVVRHLINNEKDRDVLFILKSVTQKLDEMDVKYEGQSLTTKLTRQDVEDAKKLEEEKKLSGIGAGKPGSGTIVKKGWTRTGTDSSTRGLSQSKDGTTSSRQAIESLKTSSMPEMSVMQSDDEFLVDAGIRIPTQFSVSQSTSKIPHLQDFIATRRQLNTTIRPRRSSVNFDKGKFKRHSSVEYEDCMKRGTSESDSLRSTSISIDYEEGLRQRNMVKENLSDQHLSKTDARTKRYSAPHGRTRFGWDSSQDRSLDEKLKRNSLILDKDKLKFTNSKCALDRTKRHSTNFSLKLPDTKETKQIVKRHSLEDHTTVRRAVKGYFSTLDVNHNQGLSKIPLRNVESRSRTAPATRASSPVHVESRLRFDIENCDDSRSSANDRHLNRFSSSDEEIDKLCRMLLYSQTAHSSTGITSRSRERYPVHLLMKKL